MCPTQLLCPWACFKTLTMMQNSARIDANNNSQHQAFQDHRRSGHAQQAYNNPAGQAQRLAGSNNAGNSRAMQCAILPFRGNVGPLNRPQQSTSPASPTPAPQSQTNQDQGAVERVERRAAPFFPSAMLNPYSRARRENPTPMDIAARVAAGVSPNYRGDCRMARNRPANIPADQNCSVWITGLPPNVTTNELLGAIRDTGRIWASVIHPPRNPTWMDPRGPAARFVFDIDEVVPLVLGWSINILEFHFGSYRCQAQWAWRNIQEDSDFQSRGVRARLERNPCDWYPTS
ncbi:hypothetical protein N658DRAFT_326356 [Parathielavia hyrcaniae]|uniref:Uncharacterized protein n=1 Tax=Parathielavia hyrcaniae TaxID=113614 RepID=A0AAN6T3L0_9PEZI|nr:hypothetical protein N658DRAFT_326356 [Parathielavia hyrcaniae]